MTGHFLAILQLFDNLFQKTHADQLALWCYLCCIQLFCFLYFLCHKGIPIFHLKYRGVQSFFFQILWHHRMKEHL